MENNEPTLYTVKEVSQILHTNTSFVYKLINEGHLPALKLGSIKIRRVSLEKFLDELEKGQREVN